jgi:multidrug efflux pump subunit AcrA (membrane-fusion protein)
MDKTMSLFKSFLNIIHSSSGKQGKFSLLIVAAGILVSGIIIATSPKHLPENPEEKTRTVATISVSLANLSPNISFYGKVSTPNKANLAAAIQADVIAVFTSDGQSVLQGDVLVQLDDRDARLSVDHQQALLNDAIAQREKMTSQHASDLTMLDHQQQLFRLAEKKLSRYRSLRTEKMISDVVMDEAEVLVKQQAIALDRQKNIVANYSNNQAISQALIQKNEANLNRAKLQLARTQIQAPFPGLVSGLTVAPGNRITVGEKLLGLIDTRELKIRGTIAGKYVPALKSSLAKGDTVKAIATLNKDFFELELEQLAAEVGSGRSGVEGIFNVIDTHAPLTLGQIVNLSVTLPALDAIVAVPIQSVHDNEKVFIIEKERLQAVHVNVVGERLNSQGDFELLIKSPTLKDGQQIVTSQLSQATTGMRVNVLPKSEASVAQSPSVKSQQ